MFPLFALETEPLHPAWWIGIGSAMSVVFGAIGALASKLIQLKKDARVNVDEEHARLIKLQDDRIAVLGARVEELTKQVFKLQDEAMRCRASEAELKADLQLAHSRIRILEATATVSQTQVGGYLVIDKEKKIRASGCGITQLLQYTAAELTDQPYNLLVPADCVDDYAKLLNEPQLISIDSVKPILTFAINKSGERTPVVITSHAWKTGNMMLVTLELRSRLLSNKQ